MTFNELRKHLNFKVEPDYYEMSTLKVNKPTTIKYDARKNFD